jgi:hypothetical protein
MPLVIWVLCGKDKVVGMAGSEQECLGCDRARSFHEMGGDSTTAKFLKAPNGGRWLWNVDLPLRYLSECER